MVNVNGKIFDLRHKVDTDIWGKWLFCLLRPSPAVQKQISLCASSLKLLSQQMSALLSGGREKSGGCVSLLENWTSARKQIISRQEPPVTSV